MDIFLSFGDISYVNRFPMLKNESRLFDALLTVVPFDRQTRVWCEQNRVYTVTPPGNTTQTKIYFAKVSYPLQLVKSGRTVYVSEMDVFWLVRPMFPSLRYPILVSRHRYNNEVNIGFMRLLSSHQTVHVLRNIESWLLKPHHVDHACGAFDQKIFDLAIRGPKQDNAFINRSFRGKTPECYLPVTEIRMLIPRITLRWNYISTQTLNHWPIQEIESAGVHIWSEMGSPSARISWVTNRLSN
jgi:hypothetical protein